MYLIGMMIVDKFNSIIELFDWLFIEKMKKIKRWDSLAFTDVENSR